ncbi:hypothetical protein TrispH2_012150, partial [Trichoplax sp. H2]
VNAGAILAISITDNQEESYSSGKQDYLKFGLASSFISSFSASNSMITLSFISFERYRGIVSPLSVSVSKRKIWIYIIGIWIYALICSGIVTILRATDTYQIADLQQPLHIMIANLAITDILYCLAVNAGAILAISITDNQEESYSSGKQDYLKFGLASSFISSFSASNSMITLSFISFERYRG